MGGCPCQRECAVTFGLSGRVNLPEVLPVLKSTQGRRVLFFYPGCSSYLSHFNAPLVCVPLTTQGWLGSTSLHTSPHLSGRAGIQAPELEPGAQAAVQLQHQVR